jgi:hypothetical protein
MLKGIWPGDRRQSARADADQKVDGERLRMLTEHFPIGSKVRYFPDHQRDIVFCTIVIAYRIDRQFVYCRNAIRRDAGGVPAAVAMGESTVSLDRVRTDTLQLIVPDTSDMERSLDYIRRAKIGRKGQFARGNCITLIANAGPAGVPSLETQVESRFALKDGPYLDLQVVTLQPDFSTLRIVDQRKKARISSDLPVNLYLQHDGEPVACTLADFSDVSLRLQSRAAPLPTIRANDSVFITFDLDDSGHTCGVRGSVYRATADACVVTLQHIYKDGAFVPISTLDVLEIKTSLLNRPAIAPEFV